MKTNFYLNAGTVTLSATLSDGRLKYSTGIRMSEIVFNNGVFQSVTELDRLKVLKLITISNKVVEAYLRGTTTIGAMRIVLDEITGRRRGAGESLVDFSLYFLDAYKKTHPKNTWRTFQTLINHLKELPVNLKDVDQAFYFRLMEYYDKENYALNFTSKMIRNLRRILSEAERQGKWYGRIDVFKGRYEEAYNIYLTQEELNLLYKADLPDYQRNAVNQFLVGCYTGLRYSDFSRIKPEMISNGFLTIDTQKTGERVTVPIHPVVKEILSSPTRPLSAVKLNLYIKDAAFNAGIRGVVVKHTTRGGVWKEERIERYNMVKTHTARRTFCTLMYLNKVPPELIMKISGHKSIRQLLAYIKINSEDTARLLQSNTFFNPSAPEK